MPTGLRACAGPLLAQVLGPDLSFTLSDGAETTVRKLSSKGLAERLLLLSGAARVARALRAPRLHILTYHNVVPDNSAQIGDSSLHLPVAQFESHLDAITEVAEVVSLGQLVTGGDRQTDGPRVAITFDDAYHGAMTFGVAASIRRGVPVTIFVSPGLLGDGSFWWDSLAGASGLTSEIRTHALAQLCGDVQSIRQWAVQRGLPTTHFHPAARPADEDALRHVAHERLITLASHGWRHRNLNRVDDQVLEDELRLPLDWLRSRFPNAMPWVAYPYGLYSPRVTAAALRVGYAAGFGLTGVGQVQPIEWPIAINRYNIPAGLSASGLRLRLAGVLKW